MEHSSAAKLRRVTAADLETIRGWRNDPRVSSSMFSSQTVTRNEHRAWFDRVSSDPDRSLFVLEREDAPRGFVQFHVVGTGGIAEWGFYVAPDAERGTGRLLAEHALRFAFSDANYHKVCGRVLAFNSPSIAFHLKFGFSLEGTLRDHHFDGERYHDVLCFGLLHSAQPDEVWSTP